MIPSIDELFFVDEFRPYEVCEGQYCSKIHLLLCARVALVADLNAEMSVLKTVAAEVDFEEEASAVLEDIMYYFPRTHLQLSFLRHRSIDDHKHIVETNGALVGHSYLATHREAFVAGDCELASDVELEALEQY